MPPSGKAHPMALKKELARSIVADFHSAEAAAKAGEDWAKQFQNKEEPEDVQEVPIKFEDIVTVPISEIEWSITDGMEGVIYTIGNNYPGVRLDRLLVKCGLAESASDASRKIKQGAVRVNSRVQTERLRS